MEVNKTRAKSRNKGTGKIRQLEATVHTSLPPLVTGPLRGCLRVSLERGIHWEYSIGPPAPKLCVQLKWWGEDSTGTIFRVPVHKCTQKNKSSKDCTTLAIYQIRSGWPQFKAYIQDMGSLLLHVGLGHMTDESMVIGRAALPSLSKLSPIHPLTIHSPIVNPKGLHLGKLTVIVSIQPVEQKQGPSLLHKHSSATQDDPPEFIIGPSAGKFKQNSPPDPDKIQSGDVSSSMNKERRAPYVEWEAAKSPKPQLQSDVKEERGITNIGPQQLEIISELIDRGNKLSEEMMQSLTDGVSRRHCSSSPVETEKDEETHEPLMLAGLSQDADCNNSKLLPLSRDLHELVCLAASSDEEDDHITVGVDDISLNESDYPLHDNHLLARLLYNHHNEDTSNYSRPQNEVNQTNEQSHKTCGSPTQDKCVATEPFHEPSAASIPPYTETHKQDSKLTSKLGLRDPSSAGSSLTALSSYLGSGERSLESFIVRTLGMERLTCLGRVTRARVCVESLEIKRELVDKVLSQTQHSNKRSLIPLPRSSSSSPTYFVEYQFPAALNGVSAPNSSTRLPPAHEVMRVASKKMVDNAVSFNHQSAFPVSFSSTIIQRWWNSTLIFRVYCKRLSERMPFLVGKAIVPLRSCLTSPSLDLHTQLEVRSSTITDAVNSHVTDKDPLIGQLQVLVELVSSTKKAPKPPPSPSSAVTIPPPAEREPPHIIGPAVKLQEPKPLAQTITQPPSSLQLLLMIPEATELSLTHSPRPKDIAPGRLVPPQPGVPNSYVVCKLFCAKPHPRTLVQWATHNPQFKLKQIHPLYLTPALLEQVCNNFMVIEVWHRTPGPSTDDELIGLVKVSLHQFYLAYSDTQTELYKEAKLPAITMDSYCPIVNPFSGNVNGHLAVLCALGTQDQVGLLQQQFVCGSYCLHKPHTRPTSQHRVQPPPEVALSPSNPKTHLLAHVFEVIIEGVRELAAFNSTVWGETDCFVQYHFPTQLFAQDNNDSETILLQPYRTRTTLCVPNPSFAHSTRHILSLTPTAPIQQELIHVCGQGRGLSGGVPFELWRRFYYPNVRDQLIAKAVLPIVKLCAIVSMDKGSNLQTFSLPLKLVAEADTTSREGGLLDVTVSYSTMSNSDQPDKIHKAQDQQEEKEVSIEDNKFISFQNKHSDDDSNDSSSHSSVEQPPSAPASPQQPSILSTLEQDTPPPQDAFEARVVIHNALHLQLERFISPRVYVTLHPHPNVAKVSTPALANQEMVWDHHCVTFIPNMYLEPQCSGLELQMWSKSPNPSPPAQNGTLDDCYIGSVYVDLSPLAFGLRQISGWYNAVDFGGQVKGQLKVTISPTNRISYPSRLLSYHLDSPPESFLSKGSLLVQRGPTMNTHHSISREHVVSFSQRDPSASKTTSMLYEQLRNDIKELDTIHKSLQARLGEIKSRPPFLQTHMQSTSHEQLHLGPSQTLTMHDEAPASLTTASASWQTAEYMKDTTLQYEGFTDQNKNEPLSQTKQSLVASPATVKSPTLTRIETPPSIKDTTQSPILAGIKTPPPIKDTIQSPILTGIKTPPPIKDAIQSPTITGIKTPPPIKDAIQSPTLTDVKTSPPTVQSQILTHIEAPKSSPIKNTVNSPHGHTPSDLSESMNTSDIEGNGLLSQSDTIQEGLMVNKERSCSLTDVSVTSESTDLSHSEILSQSIAHSEDNSKQNKLDSTTQTLSIKINRMQSDQSSQEQSQNDDHPNDIRSQVSTQTETIALDTHSPVPATTTMFTCAPQPLPDTSPSPANKQPLSKSAFKCSQFRQLPNFFMPPEELEESMRRLRASVLTRPAPRTRGNTGNQITKSSTVGGTHTISTLQEVQQYLDSRKLQRLPNETKPLDISSTETKRIAKIFSSRSTLSPLEN